MPLKRVEEENTGYHGQQDTLIYAFWKSYQSNNLFAYNVT